LNNRAGSGRAILIHFERTFAKQLDAGGNLGRELIDFRSIARKAMIVSAIKRSMTIALHATASG